MAEQAIRLEPLLKTDVAGRVEEFEGEFIETRFLGKLPLVPLQSYFVRQNGDVIDIPLHSKSVLYGYLRAWLGFAALVAGFACLGAFFGSNQPNLILGLLTLPLTIGAAVGWYLSVYTWGEIGEEDARERMLFLEVTGVSAPPAILGEETARQILRGLKKTWSHKHADWGGLPGWEKTIQQGSTPANMAFLAVMAAYHEFLDPSKTSKALKAEAWRQIDAETPVDDPSLIESMDSEEQRAFLKRAINAEEKRPAREEREAAKERLASTASSAGGPIVHRAKAAPRVQRTERRIKLRCPHCAEVSRVPWDYRGKKGLCPRCKKAIQVPSMRHSRAAVDRLRASTRSASRSAA